MLLLLPILLSIASAPTAFPLATYDQPVSICQQFKPPALVPLPMPQEFYAGDQLFLKRQYRAAFVAYYAIMFCPTSAGRLGVNFKAQFGDQGYFLQQALEALVKGSEEKGEAILSQITTDPDGQGAAYFFRGASKWQRGDRKGASADWVLASTSPGITQPPEEPIYIPPNVLSARFLLHKLVGVNAPPWKYGDKLYKDR